MAVNSQPQKAELAFFSGRRLVYITPQLLRGYTVVTFWRLHFPPRFAKHCALRAAANVL
jgi:hypothetical protein